MVPQEEALPLGTVVTLLVAGSEMNNVAWSTALSMLSSNMLHMAIAKMRTFFESLGIKLHLSDYNIPADRLKDVIADLEAKGLTAMSERGDLALDSVRLILQQARQTESMFSL